MNYWLVRANHKGIDQTGRFIKNNIWENGYDNKYTNSVNNIKKDDILFLANDSYIYYFAKCTENYNDGKKINIDKWVALDKPSNFPAKGAYIKTISKISGQKLKTIIINIDSTFLNKIEIKNYFSINNIEIDNLKDKKEIYFVGENGDGKTIVLQAILLAMKGDKYALLTEKYIEKIKDKMEIFIKTNKYEIDNFDLKKNIKNLFAYGINRNKVHYRKFNEFGYETLFDISDSEAIYLKDPFYELGIKYQGDNHLIKEFIKKLNSTLLQENYQIFNGGDIDFNELSEGYKSTIIWLYDLVSRLIENQPKVTKLAKLKAIVLIDEVDLYLHPKWKYDFVHNLREVFENIQFIMVTHSMVSVLGASDDAIFFKVYKEDGETKISQPMDSIKNLMANSLSTSPLFDMNTARARNNDNNLDTREDFISSKIHNIIKERTKGKKAIIEEEIIDMINQELDDYLKENDL